jgi:hypothetical protein
MFIHPKVHAALCIEVQSIVALAVRSGPIDGGGGGVVTLLYALTTIVQSNPLAGVLSWEG